MQYEQVETIKVNNTVDNATSLYEQLVHDYPFLNKSLLKRYARDYANGAYKILAGVYDINDMGSNFGDEIYQNEIDYLLHDNPNMSVDDLIWRQTNVGVKLNDCQKAKLYHYLQ
ncbi:hypothetical protein [Agaribacter flavus]|uniref:Uncharacterized protein n=1 Tax=Agaribacter flavus TaxID=1902781 RepID=A0ABV7FR29_9ALTE